VRLDQPGERLLVPVAGEGQVGHFAKDPCHAPTVTTPPTTTPDHACDAG
jgi:hypothetical protein